MHPEAPPNPIEKPGYRLVFNEGFEAPALDRTRWLPFYLPQWSSRERAAARYRLADGTLTLFIGEDQPPWCPEFDGDVRCSSLQTGVFAGPLGSAIGQHRFNAGARVREEQETLALYVPTQGYFELRAKARLGANDLAAAWMIGFEDRPERSGEIAICEIFGRNVGPVTAGLGYGIKPWGDPTLAEGDFYVDRLPFDPADFHIYAAEWTPGRVDVFFDNRKLRSIAQSPTYPMQILLNVYALPGERRVPGQLPSFKIDYFRGYEPLAGR